jgi:lactate dehydrogenase-like 2-hydroxyacid dehydrogenase
MKPDILFNFELPPLAAAMASLATVHRRPAPGTEDIFFSQVGPNIQAVVTWGSLGIANKELDLMPNVKAVLLFSAGYEGVDLDYCRARNIAVTAGSGLNADDVADLAFGLLLDVARALSHADRFVRTGGWTSTNRGPGLRDGLSGAKLGIVGLGAIGLEIARRAEGFKMDIAYTTRRPRADVTYRYVPHVLDLAREVDHLILACPLNDETKNMINADVLKALGPSGILVNIARGGVVDEPALIQALQSGTILGAGLDVFVDEPRVPAALLALDNVVLTPHLGGLTRRVFKGMGELIIENLRRTFAGEDLLSRVD